MRCATVLRGSGRRGEGEEDQAAGPADPASPVVRLAEDEAAAWLSAAVGVPAVALAGEWARGRGTISAAAVVDDRGTVAFLDCGLPAVSEVVLDWLADPRAAKDLHDGKGPALALATAGRTLAGVRIDTALAAYLAAPGHRGYGLGDVAQRVLGVTLGEAADADQLSFDTGDDVAATLAREAEVVRDLAADLGAQLSEQGVAHLLTEVEVPLVPLLARMENAGIAVDLPGLRDLSSEFGADMRAAEEQAHELVGRPFNLGSPKQLQEILFGERNLPKTKKIKTGYTTDAEALQQLYAQTGDPLLEQLLAWRDRSKLRQTVDGLIPAR